MPNVATNQSDVVVITGSSGLIGSRLAQALAGEFTIVGMDLMAPKAGSAVATFIKCDFTKDEDVGRACGELRNKHGARLVSVVHLAAYYDFSGEPSPLYEQLTVEGTRRLLEQLKTLQVEQFIFSSSLLVMEPAEVGESLTPDSPVQAQWDYPQSKLDAELVIANERGPIPVVILRIAGVYDEDCHSVPIGQQISRIHQRQLESYFFPGDARRGQSFIHLDDLNECFRQVIRRRRQLDQHEIFLIGEDDVMSYDELQDEIGRLLHDRDWPTFRIPKAVAKAGAWVQDKLAASDEDKPFIKPWMIDLADQHYPVSLKHVDEKLDWQPRHSLRQTLPEMIERLKENPRQWYKMNKLPLPAELAEAESAGARR
jgi:nucleoside-diphosphate-sugar epimerase